MRIFDNPNHPQYGPVRRMWIVLVQLDLLTAAERWSDHQKTAGNGHAWDSFLSGLVENNPQIPESASQRLLVGILLEGWA
jgi:hypothetical protein